MLPPFVQINNHWFLIVNWELSSPPESDEILLLRPLTAEEQAMLRHSRTEGDCDLWASIVCDDNARYRGRENGSTVESHVGPEMISARPSSEEG